jgi:hypothetical protein
MRTIGILLMIIGAAALIWGGISYVTDRDTVDLGNTQVVTEDRGHVVIPPIYAGAALLIGGVLVGLSTRNRHKAESESTVTVHKTVDMHE